MIEITELERRALIESIETALAEIEQSEDFTEGVYEALEDSIRILRGKVHD